MTIKMQGSKSLMSFQSSLSSVTVRSLGGG